MADEFPRTESDIWADVEKRRSPVADFDPALLEQAAKVLRADYESEYDADHIDWYEFADIARAVLEAVADDLRADAWDEGYQAAADDWCTPGVFGRVSRNPYRERADQIEKENR